MQIKIRPIKVTSRITINKRKLLSISILILLALSCFSFLIQVPFVRAESSSFGYPTVGASDLNYATTILRLNRYAAPNASDLNLTNLAIYGCAKTNGSHVFAVVYADNSGTPSNRLYTSEAITTNVIFQWNNIACNYSGLVNGSYYWFGYMAEGGDFIKSTSDASYTAQYNTVSTYPTAPDPWVSNATATRRLSMYMNYTYTVAPDPTPTATPTPTPTAAPTTQPEWNTTTPLANSYATANTQVGAWYWLNHENTTYWNSTTITNDFTNMKAMNFTYVTLWDYSWCMGFKDTDVANSALPLGFAAANATGLKVLVVASEGDYETNDPNNMTYRNILFNRIGNLTTWISANGYNDTFLGLQFDAGLTSASVGTNITPFWEAVNASMGFSQQKLIVYDAANVDWEAYNNTALNRYIFYGSYYYGPGAYSWDGIDYWQAVLVYGDNNSTRFATGSIYPILGSFKNAWTAAILTTQYNYNLVTGNCSQVLQYYAYRRHLTDVTVICAHPQDWEGITTINKAFLGEEPPAPTPTPTPTPTSSPSAAQNAADTVYTNMYVAVGFIGVSLIVLACVLLVKSFQFGEVEPGAMILAIMLLIGGAVALLVGFSIIVSLENAGNTVLGWVRLLV